MGGGGSDLLPDVGSAPQCAQRGSAVTIVVGYLAGKVGPSALHLAVRVARMHRRRSQWPPSCAGTGRHRRSPASTPSTSSGLSSWLPPPREAPALPAQTGRRDRGQLPPPRTPIGVGWSARRRRGTRSRGAGAGVVSQRAARAGDRLDRRPAAAFVAGTGGDHPAATVATPTG